MTRILPLLLAFPCLTAPAAGPASPARIPPDLEAYREAAGALLAEAASRGQAWDMLAELCRTAPHRLSGSPGAAAAVAWAERRMREIGLEEVRREELTAPCWERGAPERLRIVAPAALAGDPLRCLALGGSVGTPPEGVRGEVIEVDGLAGLEALEPGEVRGRIVFLYGRMDPSIPDPMRAYSMAAGQRVHGASRAARKGAVAAVVRSLTCRLDDVPHTGALRNALGAERIPAAAISTLAAERLSSLLATGQRVELELTMDCRWRDPAPAHNVVGELRGRELPEEIVVLGAHLDGWDAGQAAHDDGAGCCHVLEAVRLMKALDLCPRRTIRVVLFANEENGTAGARAYRAAHREELPRHVMALESDRGGFSPRGFTTTAGDEGLAVLGSIAALLEPIGADRVRPGGGGVDIGPLGRHGVPLVGFLCDSHRYFDVHHSERDTIESVHPRELNLGAGAIAALAFVVADMQEPLPR